MNKRVLQNRRRTGGVPLNEPVLVELPGDMVSFDEGDGNALLTPKAESSA